MLSILHHNIQGNTTFIFSASHKTQKINMQVFNKSAAAKSCYGLSGSMYMVILALFIHYAHITKSINYTGFY